MEFDGDPAGAGSSALPRTALMLYVAAVGVQVFHCDGGCPEHPALDLTNAHRAYCARTADRVEIDYERRVRPILRLAHAWLWQQYQHQIKL